MSYFLPQRETDTNEGSLMKDGGNYEVKQLSFIGDRMSKKGKNSYFTSSYKQKNSHEKSWQPHKGFLITESAADQHKTSFLNCEQSPDIAARLSHLHPFSRDPEDTPLQHKLKEVVSLHQKNTDSRSPSPHKPHSRRTIPSPLQQSQFILTHSLKRKRQPTNSRCKTMQDERQDPQTEIAKQMISECKKQKEQFRATLKRFQLLIEDAGEDYLEREVINCPPQMVRKCGGLMKLASKGQVCNRYEDALASYQRVLPKRKRELYGLDRQDYYSWLKSSNRLINCHREQVELQKRSEESRWSGQKPTRGGGFIYEQYFKNGPARKQLLKDSRAIG